jgi:Flp pilus assembly protein TadB
MPSAEALGSVFSVLSVLLGLLWAAGLVLLLGLGLVAHLFISRRQRRRLETV